MPKYRINVMTLIIKVPSGFIKKQALPRLQEKTDKLSCVKYCNNVTSGHVAKEPNVSTVCCPA